VGPLVLRLLCLVALGRLVWVILGYYVLDQSARHHLESAWMIFVAVAIVAAAIMPSPRAAQLRSDPIAPAAAAAWIAASLLL
jgi:TRAP-type mannitol/chloroaromatic compound transport system permease small subunit